MYIKRDIVRIKRVVLDLHDAIVDSKKVVLFEYEKLPLSSVGNSWRRDKKYGNSLLNTTRHNVQSSVGV